MNKAMTVLGLLVMVAGFTLLLRVNYNIFIGVALAMTGHALLK